MAPAEAGTWQPFIWDDACAPPRATHPDDRPGNGLDRFRDPRHPYSVLLPVGFTVPPLLPETRWALTPPFHPYPIRRPGGLLSVALSLRLPPPDVIRHRVSVEPGLSSPHRLSALVRRGCPANWQGSLSRERRQLPSKYAALSRFGPKRGNVQKNPCGSRRP